jgi:glucose/arabinose dehydrogenase
MIIMDIMVVMAGMAGIGIPGDLETEMIRRVIGVAAAGVLLTLASSASAQIDLSGSALHPFRVVTVVEGLETPWSMAWLPNGDMLVAERDGRLRIVRDGRLLPDPVAGVPVVHAEGQGGLFDVLPHPDFASNHLLYLAYADPNDGASTTRVVRARFENDRLGDLEEIFKAVAQGRDGHYGGKLAFDRDGYLFITTGDRQVPPEGNLEAHPAQDVSNHHGVLVRLHDDGRVPDDNPFVGQAGALPEIWSYGHRNMQGLAIHPETNDAWTTEHGPQGGDEVNRPEPGKNYGWPVIGYGVNYRTGLAIHGGTMRDGMEHPQHVWVPSIAASGLMFYTGDRFPRWKGNMFAGGLAGQQLARLTLSEDGKTIEREETLLQGIGRIRDVRQGPDGYIYVAIEDDDGAPSPIVRLEPADSSH